MSAAVAAGSVRSALSTLAAGFRAAGVESPGLDARLLVAHALELSREDLLRDPDRPITAAQEAGLRALSARRLAGEPVARILGTREFWGLEFRLSADTLVPRPETETVVEAALALLADRRAEPLRIADLGTGTGCLLVALLCELPNALGIGVDMSPGALGTARGNACRLGVGARALFARGHWAHALARDYDLIVSNPPYIVTAELAHLPPEVRRDPVLALDGGQDGLGAYRALVGDAAAALAPGGTLLLEVGHRQAAPVAGLLRGQGLAPLPVRHDILDVERVVGAHRPRTA